MVLSKLARLGVPFVRVNLDDLAYKTPASIRVSKNKDLQPQIILYHPYHGPINLTPTKLAWTAYLPNVYHREDTAPWPIANAIQNELINQALAISRLLAGMGVKWFNRLHEVITATKIYDLLAARNLGFAIPETLVAAYEPESSARLQRGAWVYKLLSTQSIALNSNEWLAAYTQPVTKELVEAIQNQNREMKFPPLIFQEAVPKAFEVRAFFFGSLVRSVKINSTKHPSTSLDWRRHPTIAASIMSRFELPEEVRTRGQQLMHTLGLQVGAFDFIVRPDDTWVFLEVNRTPSWNWMQKPLGEDLTLKLAEELANAYYSTS